MAVSEVSATAEYSGGGYRPPGRRPAQEPPAPPAPHDPIEASPDAFPLDVDFYASRFRADLSALKPPPAGPDAPDASDGHDDPRLFDFFANLNVLLLAVRSGDITRAQAAAKALEMEALVERSAFRRGGEPEARPDDLARALAAASAPAPEPPPAPYPESAEADAGGAAYETLAQFFDAEARAV